MTANEHRNREEQRSEGMTNGDQFTIESRGTDAVELFV